MHRWTPLLALALLAPAASADTYENQLEDTLSLLPSDPAGDGAGVERDGDGCDNYGHVWQVGVGNEYECHSVVQHCDQGTGAGAGAGAGGTGTNDAGASASAGTRCHQEYGGGEGGGGGPGGKPLTFSFAP